MFSNDKLTDRFVRKITVLVVLMPLARLIEKSGSPLLQGALIAVLIALVAIFLFLWARSTWFTWMVLKPIDRAIEHWRQGRTGEAIRILNTLDHPVAKDLLASIHAGNKTLLIKHKPGNPVIVTRVAGSG